jgi:hypothetical protein
MYAPKGKMGLTLKFTSQEGHFGTMQMTGGMSRSEELGECRRFWIEERQSVPGFLAQVTTEMFEKTTVSERSFPEPKSDEGICWRGGNRMEAATENVWLKSNDGVSLALV